MRPDSQTDDLDLIQKQIEKLSNACAELTAAYALARRIRFLLMMAVAVFVIAVSFAFYRLGSGLMKDEYTQQLTDIAEKRLEKNQDRYMRHVELLVDHTTPAITDAFSKQANKDMPAYLNLMERERDTFAKELETKLGKRLQDRYEHSLDKHEQILKTEFPQVKDQVLHDRMMNNLHIAIDRLMQKYYVTEIERQLQQLFQAWDKFPPADPPRKNELPLEQQFTAELYRLLAIKLGSTQAARP
jgi:hypothetical protein